MSTSVERINALFKERVHEREPILNKWREVAELADGEVRIVMPERDMNEKATVVNLFPGGLSALAQRAASVRPDQEWPAVRPGFKVSEAKARDRRQAGLGWWKMNDTNLKDRQRFMYFFGFGMMPVTVLPTTPKDGDNRDMPHFLERSPLTCFPAPTPSKNDMVPADAIFCSRRPRKWLEDRYPGAMRRMSGRGARPDDLFEVLEYIDCDEIVLCCASSGGREERSTLWSPEKAAGSACVELERIVNKAGRPLAVIPGRITLSRLQGALDQMLPAYHKAAKLDAMNILAIAESIYPEKWVMSHPGDPQSPEIVTDANSAMGIIGEIAHGVIQQVGNPVAGAQAAEMAIDRLERSERLAAGLPAMIGGEGATNVRTARQGDTLLGSAIDMPLQEAQEIMAASKEAELRCAVAVQKGWFGKKATSFYIPERGFDPTLDDADYTPNDTFETDNVVIKYPLPGTDANSLVVAILQRTQGGLISQQTGREMDPAVEDPIDERDQIELEGIRRALLASLEQQAQQGMLGPDQIALIAKIKWATHGELEDVVLEAHKQTQAQQAAQQQMQPGAPGAQPGLGQPNPGQALGGAPSSANLQQVLQTLAAPAKQGQQEAAQTPPPGNPMAA